jgi:archaemetzincin
LNKKGISLISQGQFEKEFLEKMAHDVEIEFELPVHISAGYTDLSAFFDPSRRQYDANQLLKLLDSDSNPKALKTIALFQVDLFIPILTFIFGQAIFKGKTGIVSLYRLKNEQYGLPGNKMLLFERFRKVVIHELGHTFGLIHCHVPSCVMRSTTYVEEIDQKKPHFCNKCRGELEVAIQDLCGI